MFSDRWPTPSICQIDSCLPSIPAQTDSKHRASRKTVQLFGGYEKPGAIARLLSWAMDALLLLILVRDLVWRYVKERQAMAEIIVAARVTWAAAMSNPENSAQLP